MLTTGHLRRLGLSASATTRWARAGRLFPRYRGVFAVGRRELTPRGEWRAALDAIGEGAWISHGSAVELLGWRVGISFPIHVTTTRQGLRQRRGLVIHCVAEPPAATTRRGLPVTTAARTIADMAADLDDRGLIRLCNQAAFAGGYYRGLLLAELDGGRSGTVRLRRVLAALDVGGGHTRSELEDALRALIRRHRIRPPLFNEPLGEYVADALWWGARLVVELDSRLAHSSEPALFNDREKDLVYAEHGLECLRLTWRHVVGEEARVARLLLTRVGRT